MPLPPHCSPSWHFWSRIEGALSPPIQGQQAFDRSFGESWLHPFPSLVLCSSSLTKVAFYQIISVHNSHQHSIVHHGHPAHAMLEHKLYDRAHVILRLYAV